MKNAQSVLRVIRGFVAWCNEFVGEVQDNKGTPMNMEFQEQLDVFRGIGEDQVQVAIPDILDDEMLVKVLDELQYRLKSGWYGGERSSLVEDLGVLIARFIVENNLNGDQHSFALLHAKVEGWKLPVSSETNQKLCAAQLTPDEDDTGEMLNQVVEPSIIVEKVEVPIHTGPPDPNNIWSDLSEGHAVTETGDCAPWCPACGPQCEHGDNSYTCARCNPDEAEPDVDWCNKCAPKGPPAEGDVWSDLEGDSLPPGHRRVTVTCVPKMKHKAPCFDGSVGGMTLRSCLDCGALVLGGPTRCGWCAHLKKVGGMTATKED